ncbi:MAG: hypothetical protein CMJ28_02730 [Phycisphaerae bacterium]|jgi:flagellar export protein FliJ|nr:hypothetical protein [Phycisphaerae bacterium]
MKPFHFPLDALLLKLEAHERLANEALAVLQRVRTAQENQLREIARKNQQDLENQSSALVGIIDPDAVRNRAARTFSRSREADRLVLEMAAGEPALQEARADLASVRRKRRQYEVLRERRLEAHQQEQRRRDQMEMDEIAQRVGSSPEHRWRMA